MKLIITNNTILSLENVRRADKKVSGTGSKANPYSYSIQVTYTNDAIEFITFEHESECDSVYKSIAEILAQ